MANFSKIFRADIVSASFDQDVQDEASDGRTDKFRRAFSAQFGAVLPIKKQEFLKVSTAKLAAAMSGDTLGLVGYKQRAALCCALECISLTLNRVECSEDSVLSKYTKAFAPEKRASKPKAAATPTITQESAIDSDTAKRGQESALPETTAEQAIATVIAMLLAGKVTPEQRTALRDALDSQAPF